MTHEYAILIVVVTVPKVHPFYKLYIYKEMNTVYKPINTYEYTILND